MIGSLTVQENLMMGAYIRSDKAGIQESLEEVFSPLPDTQGKSEAAGRHPLRRRAADAGDGRGLMASPSYCCWTSRPWACPRSWWGRSSTSSPSINKQGTTILLVEQNAFMALQVATGATCWRPEGRPVRAVGAIAADDRSALPTGEIA